jgi:DnaJ-class molecular chaperone
MKRSKPKEVGTEIECPACDGTGFPKVRQPDQPGRKIYPSPCKRCFGKGRIEATAMMPGDRGLGV